MTKSVLVIGGNRFFGRHLAKSLLEDGHRVTLVNRGKTDDGLGSGITRVQADRTKRDELQKAIGGRDWDVIFDQVCFTAQEAREICEIVKGRAGKLVFTSSQSVYKAGSQLPESAFDPSAHTFTQELSREGDYAEAKRQAEVSFTKNWDGQLLLMRIPLVIGTDDYTGRFKWHVDRIANSTPSFFPNLDAHLCFVRSDLAGRAIKELAMSDASGPMNCACPGTISIRDLISKIERATGGKLVMAANGDGGAHSPYGLSETWTMGLEKMFSFGVKPAALDTWIDELITQVKRETK